MTAWPEGRMGFVCTDPAEKAGGRHRWLGEVAVKSHSMCMAELLIYGRGSRINAVIGKYMSGQYICIPDMPLEQAVRSILEQGEAVRAYE